MRKTIEAKVLQKGIVKHIHREIRFLRKPKNRLQQKQDKSNATNKFDKDRLM